VVVLKEIGGPMAGQLAKIGLARLYDSGASGIFSEALELDTGHGTRICNEKRVAKLQ
jgi:hypothetical protein